MSEKRFYIEDGVLKDGETGEAINLYGIDDLLNEQSERIKSLEMELDLIANTKLFSRRELERKVDEQQATIRKLQDLCGKSDYENAKLRQELKQKEEEEKLYAQEILRLNELLKQYQSFKDLGGDY